MQYIALAFDSLHCEALNNSIIDLAKAQGFEAIENMKEVAGDGLQSFIDTRKISTIIFLNFPPRKSIKFSSAGINEDIANSTLDERKSKLELFLSNALPLFEQGGLYIIFAEEWYAYSYVKYYEGSLDKLIQILNLNEGWQTLLFNFDKEEYSYDSETPLVFRLKQPLKSDLSTSS